MLTEEKAKEVIKVTVKKSILNYAKNRLKKKPNFQILDLIIPRERNIRSIVGGLETSLGTTLWEPLAKALATENGFKVIDANLVCPVNMPANLNNTLHTILDERKRNSAVYNAVSSKQGIVNVCQIFTSRPIADFEEPPRGRGVDIWLQKNDIDYFFDTKTVQPNLRGLSSYMEQVLFWYAYYYSKNPKGNAEARIIFPYNPHNGDFWSHVTGKGLPLEKYNEAWVEDEFWDFCSGLSNTFSLITQAFKDLRESKELEKEINELFK